MPLILPDPDTTQLARSPLAVVVCQVRHEKRWIVGESSTALAVHDALGGSGGPYSVIEQSSETTLNFVAGPGVQAGGVSESQISGWRLRDDQGTWVVTIMPDHFALETTAYTTWGEFEPRLSAVIDAVKEHVGPAFEQRVGLRYVDRITDPAVETIAGWQEYIRPEILGVIAHPDLGEAVVGAQQQVLFELGEGTIVALRHGPIPEGGQVEYLLDYDIHRQGGRAFDAAQLKETVQGFNVRALQLFQATITPVLFGYLRGDR